MIHKELTLDELKAVFRNAGVEYYIKKAKDGIVKVHFLIKDETDES